MTILLMDSFDDGLYAQKYTGSGQAVIVAAPRTGTSSLNLADNNNAYIYRNLPVGEQHGTMILGLGFFSIGSPNDSRCTNWSFSGSGSTVIQIRYNFSTSGLDVWRGGSPGSIDSATLIASSDPNVVLPGLWYWIETKVFVDDTVGTVEIRVNGTTRINFVGDTRSGVTSVLLDQIFIGCAVAGGRNANFRVDDVVMLNGAGSAPNNNFIGDSRVHNLLPTGNGNYSQLLGSDGNSTDNYLLVDENPPNTSDYVGSGTSGQKDSYPVTDLPAAAVLVRGVAQRAYAASSDAGPRAARNFVRIAGADYTNPDYNLGANYLLYSDISQVSPATAAAWTVAEVNAAEFGFECRA